MLCAKTLSGLALDILKVESWTQMGRTANIIIKYSIHVFASICKNTRILLMGRRYRERCLFFSCDQAALWMVFSVRLSICLSVRLSHLFTPQPSGLEGYCRHGWAGGCQTCGTHISVTAWRIFSIRSSVELSRPLVVHCHGHLPICPIWACPWAKNLSNLAQIGSRLCGTQISETAGWIYPI